MFAFNFVRIHRIFYWLNTGFIWFLINILIVIIFMYIIFYIYILFLAYQLFMMIIMRFLLVFLLFMNHNKVISIQVLIKYEE